MTTFTCEGFAFIFMSMTCTMPEPPPPAVVCPPVRVWSREFQKQVADELRAAPNGALAKVAVQTIGDRDVARACRATTKRR